MALRREGWDWLGGEAHPGTGGGLREGGCGSILCSRLFLCVHSLACLLALSLSLRPSFYIQGFKIMNTFSVPEKQHTFYEPQGPTGMNQSPGPIGVPHRNVFKGHEVIVANTY